MRDGGTLPSSTDYTHNFDPEWYLDTYYASWDDGDFLNFILKSFHEVFHTGALHGKTLLDIGTGPSIHSIISASSYFDEIYLTDFAECNRNILMDWKNGKRQNGIELCESVIVMEKNKFKQTKEDRVREIRRKIKAVLPIDITKDTSLDIPAPDIITSCLCLEAACATVDQYRIAVKNIASLLNSGKHLVVVGVLNQSFYRVGDFKFLCLSIDKKTLQKSFTENGFKIMFWREYFPPEQLETDPEYSNFQTAFVLEVVKI